MKSLKTLLLGTTLAAGALLGTTAAHADTAYTVKSGDSLSTISQQFVGNNDLIQAIAEKNGISNIHMIFEGQQLTIPTETSVQPVASPVATQSEEVYSAPAVQEVQQPVAPVVEQAPVQQAAPVAEQAPAQPAATVQEAPKTEEAAAPANSSSAKEWIAQKESSGSYTATNGRYIGRYQLDASYLNGDYSAANQEKVADSYVAGRYGSWEGAQAFWQANGWY